MTSHRHSVGSRPSLLFDPSRSRAPTRRSAFGRDTVTVGSSRRGDDTPRSRAGSNSAARPTSVQRRAARYAGRWPVATPRVTCERTRSRRQRPRHAPAAFAPAGERRLEARWPQLRVSLSNSQCPRARGAVPSSVHACAGYSGSSPPLRGVSTARVFSHWTGASPPRGGTTDQGREHDQPRGDDALRWRAPASRRPPVPGLCEGDQADGNGPVRQRSDHLRAVSITRPVGRRRHARVSRVRCRVGSSVSNQVTSGMRRSSGQSRTSFPSGRRSNRWSLTLRRDMGGRQCRRLRHRTPPARWCAVGAACATHFVETAHQPPHEAARGEPPHTAGKNPGRTDEAGVDPHYLPMHAVDHTPPIRRGAVCQRSTWRSR